MDVQCFGISLYFLQNAVLFYYTESQICKMVVSFDINGLDF